MINVIFPPGCYGTYLTRCLYHYTDLRSDTFAPFTFDHNGSSHQHRDNKIAHTKITSEHFESILKINTTNNIISLLPDADHNLDYYNNQFFKQQHGALISYILDHFSQDEVTDKLFKHWGHTGPLNNTIPNWILREWCSFWITDLWNNTYSRKNYLTIPDSIQIEVNDLLSQFEKIFVDIVNKLKLTVNVDLPIIRNTHNVFLSKQQFHNSQLNCIQWVNVTLNTDIDSPINTLTIFDEAYIQHLLRQQGYEIKCDGLNEFPATTLDLKNIIYKI